MCLVGRWELGRVALLLMYPRLYHLQTWPSLGSFPGPTSALLANVHRDPSWASPFATTLCAFAAVVDVVFVRSVTVRDSERPRALRFALASPHVELALYHWSRSVASGFKCFMLLCLAV